MVSSSFQEKVIKHWTSERVQKLCAGKKLLILPNQASALLRALGILNQDASMSADNVRKFLQVNHMLALLKPTLDELIKRFPTVVVADMACGKSYLSFVLAYYLRDIAAHPFSIICIDERETLMQKVKVIAENAGFASSMKFVAQRLQGTAGDLELFAEYGRAHLVVGLHACDVATDYILASAVHTKADAIAVAPCCQAELARQWSDAQVAEHSAFYSAFKTPNFRRELAAEFTDLMRMLLMRAHGYQVTATEFVDVSHSPKNRLLIGLRRGNYLVSAEQEYQALVQSLHGAEITLRGLLKPS